MSEFKIKSPETAICTISPELDENGLKIYSLKIKNISPEAPENICISFRLPALGMFSVWNANLYHMRELNANWNANTANSRLCSGAPVHQITGASDENALTLAVLDGSTPLSISTGIVEETAEVICKITLFTKPVSPFSEYETKLRIDSRHIPYNTALADVKKWWVDCGGLTEAYVPDEAKRPVNSIWYSFHQNIDVPEIVRQCKLSAKLGIKSVIIDDGWQTDNSERGYAYCGDWEPYEGKFPDMASHVKRVHDIGMKYILWYSVPFVGTFTKAYDEFKGMFLRANSRPNEYVLDPRYKEVRDYLISVYKNALINWNLDGFKLDFIDS